MQSNKISGLALEGGEKVTTVATPWFSKECYNFPEIVRYIYNAGRKHNISAFYSNSILFVPAGAKLLTPEILEELSHQRSYEAENYLVDYHSRHMRITKKIWAGRDYVHVFNVSAFAQVKRLPNEPLQGFASRIAQEAKGRIAEFETFAPSPKLPTSPGSFARTYLRKHHPDIGRSWQEIPDNLKRIIEKCFKGSIFDTDILGRSSSAWIYDLQSAYPAGMISLPKLIPGKFAVREVQEAGDCDLGFYEITVPYTRLIPLGVRFWLDVIYPTSLEPRPAFVTRPELDFLSKRLPVRIIRGAEIDANTEQKEFPDIEELFAKRASLKASGRLSLSDAMKSLMVAMYGITARRSEQTCNFAYASYITAFPRVRMWELIERAGAENVISKNADSLMTRTDLKLNEGEGIGKWSEKFADVDVTIYGNGQYLVEQAGKPVKVAHRSFGTLTPEMLRKAEGYVLNVPDATQVVLSRKGAREVEIETEAKLDTRAILSKRDVADLRDLKFEVLNRQPVATWAKSYEEAMR